MATDNERRLWRVAGCLAFAVAGGLLLRRQWGPLLEFDLRLWPADGSATIPALAYAATSTALAGVLWVLTRFVDQGLGYRGLDRPALIAVGILVVDAVANLSLASSGAPGFAIYPIPLGFTILLSYPQFLHFALGTALIGVGYSLLRLPPGAAVGLREYARLQIAAGALMAAPPLMRLWPLVAAAACGVLGLMLYKAAGSLHATPRAADR